MHRLAAFILGCVAGYVLNECVDSIIGSLGNGQGNLALPEGSSTGIHVDSA